MHAAVKKAVSLFFVKCINPQRREKPGRPMFAWSSIIETVVRDMFVDQHLGKHIVPWNVGPPNRVHDMFLHEQSGKQMSSIQIAMP